MPTKYATSALSKTLAKTFSGGEKGGLKTYGMPPKKSMSIMMGGSTQTFINLLNDKKMFLIYVFSNLIVQLGITYYVMMNYTIKNTTMTNLLLFIFQIVMIFILALVPMPAWMKFILFSAFSTSFGIMLSSLKTQVDNNIIQTAILGTMGIFASMFGAGLGLILFGVKLGSQFGLALFCALVLLVVSTIVIKLLGAYSAMTKGLSIIGLFLFSLFILYDTNNILQRDYYGDFVTASLDYYLDILNIFINLVNIENN
jgi:FtsH-binding integral membrane protein